MLLQALRAAAGDVDHPHDPDGTCCGVPAGTPQRDPQARSSASLADALLVIAESFLADKIAAADNPDLPATRGTIANCHDADITTETIIPAWYGERLDLDYAIYTCFANAEYHEKARQREPGEAREREHQAQAA